MAEFTPMRRKDRELPQDEARKLLTLAKWGTLSVCAGENGYPYGVALNCAFVDGALLFHSAKQGAKLDLLGRDNRACFTATLSHVLVPQDYTAHFESVVCFGRVERVPESEAARALTQFCAAVFDMDEEAMREKCEQAANYTLLLRMRIDHMTGKRSGPKRSV